MSVQFPFIGTIQALNTSSLPLFKMYAWDFETDNFIYDDNGKHILLEGNDALAVWIYKALKTQRFVYRAYSWRYGSELKKYIGKVMGVQERKSEMKRMIVEALMCNPFIKSINKVEFVEDKHKRELHVNITVSTIYGALTV